VILCMYVYSDAEVKFKKKLNMMLNILEYK
jgi:hypothetical protein